MKLTIGHLYPDLLNLYGDRGNIQCFRKRLEWRGIDAEVVPVLSGEYTPFFLPASWRQPAPPSVPLESQHP